MPERIIESFCISIHSLRMEGDYNGKTFLFDKFAFQSTPSAWRETAGKFDVRTRGFISIHSLRMEGD